MLLSRTIVLNPRENWNRGGFREWHFLRSHWSTPFSEGCRDRSIRPIQAKKEGKETGERKKEEGKKRGLAGVGEGASRRVNKGGNGVNKKQASRKKERETEEEVEIRGCVPFFLLLPPPRNVHRFSYIKKSKLAGSPHTPTLLEQTQTWAAIPFEGKRVEKKRARKEKRGK